MDRDRRSKSIMGPEGVVMAETNGSRVGETACRKTSSMTRKSEIREMEAMSDSVSHVFDTHRSGVTARGCVLLASNTRTHTLRGSDAPSNRPGIGVCALLGMNWSGYRPSWCVSHGMVSRRVPRAINRRERQHPRSTHLKGLVPGAAYRDSLLATVSGLCGKTPPYARRPTPSMKHSSTLPCTLPC